MTETEQRVHMVSGSYEILENEALAKMMDSNLRTIGVPRFNADELEFARKLQNELGQGDFRPDADPIETSISKFESTASGGSTDVGDVSWVVPTAGLNIATATRSTQAHSWSMVACSGSALGRRGALVAAKVLAATALDVFEDPALVAKAKADFERRKGTVAYYPLLDVLVPARVTG